MSKNFLLKLSVSVVLCAWLGIAGASEGESTGSLDPILLVEKLFEIAEGPVPTRDVIENQFKFKFNQGKLSNETRYFYGYVEEFPFRRAEDYRGHNVVWREYAEQIALIFHFQFDNWTKPLKGCVLITEIERLLGKNWTSRVKSTVHGHFSDYIVYKYDFSNTEIYTRPGISSNQKCVMDIYIYFTR